MLDSVHSVLRVVSSVSSHVVLCILVKKSKFGLVWSKFFLSHVCCVQRGFWQTANLTSYGFLSTMAFFSPLFHKHHITGPVSLWIHSSALTWAVDLGSVQPRLGRFTVVPYALPFPDDGFIKCSSFESSFHSNNISLEECCCFFCFQLSGHWSGPVKFKMILSGHEQIS